MYSASFSIRWVTEATPAVSVGVARGEEEMTTGTGGMAAVVAGAPEGVLALVPTAVPTAAPDVTVPGALAGFLSRWAGLPEIAGSAGVKFILGAVRRSGNGKILPEGLNYCYPRHSHRKERRSQLTLEPFQHFNADLAGGDFAQRDDGRLVLGVDFRRVALQQLARAIGRRQRQLETVRDIFQTIFNRDTGHLNSWNRVV